MSAEVNVESVGLEEESNSIIVAESQDFKAECKDEQIGGVDEETVKVETAELEEPSDNRNEEAVEPSRYEIKIQDIPRYVTTKQLKQYVGRFGVTPKKVSVHTNHSYLSFLSDAERLKAVESLNGLVWKKCTLKVRCSDKEPPKDGGNKRKDTDRSNGPNSKRVCVDQPDNEPVDIVSKVTPLHQMPYEDQLKLKMNETTKALCNISRQMREANSDFTPGSRSSYIGELMPIVPCPVQSHYRNKCEFTVGLDTEGQPTVGFRMSKCKDGPSTVARPDGCTHLPEWTLRCVRHFQQFLSVAAGEGSDKPVYDVVKKTGFWRQLTVRCFTFDLLVIVTVHPQEFSTEQLDVVKKQLIELFFSEPPLDEKPPEKTPLDFRVTSLYFQMLRNTSDPPVYELLQGVPYVYENLINPFSGTMMRFRISPGAFFQTCSRACPVLFSHIGQMCKLSAERTLLLDICCGTGTIGIFLATQVKRVIGVELCKEAVADAIENARGNEVLDRCKYHCGKAEDVLVKLFTTGAVSGGESEDVVAILDPPRAGLADKIIMGIRRAEFIKRLVYISCDVRGASKNLVDLSRKQSNKYVGTNFTLTKSVPIDMFPQTSHCEMVMLFER